MAKKLQKNHKLFDSRAFCRGGGAFFKSWGNIFKNPLTTKIQISQFSAFGFR